MKMKYESGVGSKEAGVGEWSWKEGRWSRRVELEGSKVEGAFVGEENGGRGYL